MPDNPTILSCDETLSFTEDKVMEIENEYRKCRARNDDNPTLRDGKRVAKITCKDNPEKSLIENIDSLVVNAINSWRRANLTKEQQKQFNPIIYPPDEVMAEIYRSVLDKISKNEGSSTAKKKERDKFFEGCNGKFNIQVIAICNRKKPSTYIQ